MDAEARRQGRPAACTARPRRSSLPLRRIDSMKLGGPVAANGMLNTAPVEHPNGHLFQMHGGMQRMKKAPSNDGAF